jgi:serine protease Do
MELVMTVSESSAPKTRKAVSARRLVLLATVGALGASAFFVQPWGGDGRLPAFASPAYAQSLQRPVGFADVVEKVKPAVISVRIKRGVENSSFSMDDNPFGHQGQGQGQGTPFEFFFRRFGQGEGGPGPNMPRRQHRNLMTGQGSGFFISADGYAVTNNHVVDKAEQVEITADDGKTYSAKVIGTDPRTDLALVKVEGRTDFPFVRLADHAPRIGDWVIAVGNPFGLGGTVTAGIVSARGRDIGAGPYDDFIQIDAPVNKGNSGGPTFDVDGNVIGVNTAIFSPSGGSVGIAFAIPSETVNSVVNQLKDKGAVTRGWIGVQIQQINSDIADSLGLKSTDGALVAEPQSGSPADKAGIKSGDVIANVNGEAVKDARMLARTISRMPPGTTVKLDLIRKGKPETVTLTLGELPKQQLASAEGKSRGGDADIPKLGLSLAPASGVAGAGEEGVIVTDIDPNGKAADRFKTGDVILDVGGAAVSSPADVRKAISSAHADGKHTVLMRVKSAQGVRFVAVPIG